MNDLEPKHSDKSFDKPFEKPSNKPFKTTYDSSQFRTSSIDEQTKSSKKSLIKMIEDQSLDELIDTEIALSSSIPDGIDIELLRKRRASRPR